MILFKVSVLLLPPVYVYWAVVGEVSVNEFHVILPEKNTSPLDVRSRALCCIVQVLGTITSESVTLLGTVSIIFSKRV